MTNKYFIIAFQIPGSYVAKTPNMDISTQFWIMANVCGVSGGSENRILQTIPQALVKVKLIIYFSPCKGHNAQNMSLSWHHCGIHWNSNVILTKNVQDSLHWMLSKWQLPLSKWQLPVLPVIKKNRQHDIFVAMFLPNADTRKVNSYPVFTSIVGLRVAMSHSTGRLLINHVLIGTEWCRAEERDAFHYHA